jgi:hypothetical protein
VGLLQRLNRPSLWLCLGALLGLLVAAWPGRLATAQATLCFPPRVKLPRYVTPADKPAREAPLSWATTILSSKGAMNFLCAKFERSSLENKAEIVREACLLTAEDRIRVEAYQDYCLRLQVRADQPEVALVLCQNLVGYLASQSQQAVEEQAAYRQEEFGTLEKQLRALEKSVSAGLWLDLALDAKPREIEERQATAADLSEFTRQVQQYRDGIRDRFFGEIQAAAEAPTFTVLEPAYLVEPARPWAWGAGIGAMAGLALWALVRWQGRPRPSAAPAREPWIVRRNTSP